MNALFVALLVVVAGLPLGVMAVAVVLGLGYSIAVCVLALHHAAAQLLRKVRR